MGNRAAEPGRNYVLYISSCCDVSLFHPLLPCTADPPGTICLVHSGDVKNIKQQRRYYQRSMLPSVSPKGQIVMGLSLQLRRQMEQES